MPAHVFVLDDNNYNICIRRGLVGLPEASEDSRNEHATNDALLSNGNCPRRGSDMNLGLFIRKSKAI